MSDSGKLLIIRNPIFCNGFAPDGAELYIYAKLYIKLFKLQLLVNSLEVHSGIFSVLYSRINKCWLLFTFAARSCRVTGRRDFGSRCGVKTAQTGEFK